MSQRPCAECGECVPGHPSPDPCFGLIPGVSHACCGHGTLKDAYVVLGGDPNQSCIDIEEFLILRGRDALKFFELALRGLRYRGEDVQRPEYVQAHLAYMQRSCFPEAVAA